MKRFYAKHKKYPIIDNKQKIEEGLFDTCHLQDYQQTKKKLVKLTNDI